MTAIDPRDFTKIVTNNETVLSGLKILTDEELDSYEEIFELKKRIVQNNSDFSNKRERLEKISSQYKKVNEEYWLRGAGWNVEYLKIEKTKLKAEIEQLSEILALPNQDMTAMTTELTKRIGSDNNFRFYEHYRNNFEPFQRVIGIYSVFSLMEDDVQKKFVLVPEWVSKVASVSGLILLSEKSALGQICHKREVGEKFEYQDGDGQVRNFELVETRLISSKEINDLNQKINIGFVIAPSHSAEDALNLNNLGHLASPIPFGGGGERRFNQLRPY